MAILNACTRNVITVTRESSVQEAAKLMKEKNIGNIVIVEKKENKVFPAGILTDRDIAIKIAAEDADVNSITVGDVTVESLFTLKASYGIKEALREMSKKGVRRAPVVNENNELVGIVTLDDLLVLLAEEINLLAQLVRKQGAGGPVFEDNIQE